MPQKEATHALKRGYSSFLRLIKTYSFVQWYNELTHYVTPHLIVKHSLKWAHYFQIHMILLSPLFLDFQQWRLRSTPSSRAQFSLARCANDNFTILFHWWWLGTWLAIGQKGWGINISVIILNEKRRWWSHHDEQDNPPLLCLHSKWLAFPPLFLLHALLSRFLKEPLMICWKISILFLLQVRSGTVLIPCELLIVPSLASQ